MTPPQITEGIKSFLSIPHTGAIVISGPWGSGKSYYVKNQLKKEIANTPYLPTNKVEEKGGTFSKKIKNIVKKHLPAEDKYYPIMFSVFGLSSLSEVQNKLTTTFLGEVSDGSSDKLGYIFKGVKNTISSIPKLNEWLDTEKIFDPKILSFLFTPNMVIIIDDLERLNTDKIPFQDFLGFINDLSENNGYKVILLSNHSFLLEKNKDNLEFHEKAVEKTLNFEADIISIIENIAREIGEESFAEFIKGQQRTTEHILNHFYDKSFIDRGKPYSNLRTVKFALNHFYEIFKNRKNLDEEYADFILRDSWFQILSVALEYKEALSYDESIGNLIDYYPVKTTSFNFDLNDSDSDEGDNNPFGDQNLKEVVKTREKHSENFRNNFREKYYDSLDFSTLRAIINPIVEYIGGRISLNSEKIKEINDIYITKRNELTPKENRGENIMEKFMTSQWINFSNEEMKENLILLKTEAFNGNLRQLISYINAYVYLSNFADSIGSNDEEIVDGLKKGINKWLNQYGEKLNSFEIERFRIVRGQLEPKTLVLFDYIDDRLKDISNRLIKKDEEDTIRFFLEDMRKFHDALVPLQQPGRNSWSLTEIMMRPFLQNISIDQIENRVKEMSMNDVSLLEEVLRYRYDNREIREKLLPDETSFLTNLKSTILDQEGIEPSILWAKRILLQRLNKLLP